MTVAVFTRAAPCTKIHLHNCFFRGGKYVSRTVPEAWSEIGKLSPAYLLDKGYVVMLRGKQVDTYTLSKEGEKWLQKGTLRYLELHPEALSDCNETPLGYATKRTARKLVRRIKL